MLPDYHIHTWRCGHATGELNEYVEAARINGLKEIGFADHIPLYWLPEAARDPGLAMKEEDLKSYIEEVKRLQRNNPDLTVRLGIEADYIPGKAEKLADLLSAYPFDYLIGSVHYLNGWGFDHPDRRNEYSFREIKEVYASYFSLLQDAACSGIFDIIAHPDLVKKFGYRPKIDPSLWYEQTARVFARCGVCVEVNTAGLRAPAAEIYPALDFLRACRKYNVPVTTGSDAHSPAQVGYGWKEVRQWLQAAGYREVAFFCQRSSKLKKFILKFSNKNFAVKAVKYVDKEKLPW
jgi:histidinol-phosphatase (PHP family)